MNYMQLRNHYILEVVTYSGDVFEEVWRFEDLEDIRPCEVFQGDIFANRNQLEGFKLLYEDAEHWSHLDQVVEHHLDLVK